MGKVLQLARLHGAALAAIPCGRVGKLPDQDHLWRRFTNSPNHLTWDADLERWIPSLSILQFDPEMSTYWREHLRMHGKGASSVLTRGYTLVGELDIGKIQRQGFPTRQSPNDEPSIGCAHVSIHWPPESVLQGRTQPSKDQRKLLRMRLASEFIWVYGDVPTSGPAGA